MEQKPRWHRTRRTLPRTLRQTCNNCICTCIICVNIAVPLVVKSSQKAIAGHFPVIAEIFFFGIVLAVYETAKYERR